MREGERKKKVSVPPVNRYYVSLNEMNGLNKLTETIGNEMGGGHIPRKSSFHFSTKTSASSLTVEITARRSF